MAPASRFATSAALLPLLLAAVSGIVLESANPLLDLNDHLLQHVLSSSENEVTCPAALFEVISAAHQAGNDTIRDVIEQALSTETPGRVSKQIRLLAEKEPSLKQFFQAYSLPKVLSECAPERLHSLSKQKRCARLTELLTGRGRQMDLSQPSAVAEINGDVSAATDGLIRDLFTHLDPQTRLVLASALSFSAKWLPELEAAPTGQQFRRPAGAQRVPAVHVSAPLRFVNVSTDGVLGAALPYSVPDLQLEMFFFVAADRKADVAPLLRRRHYEALADASPLDKHVVLTFPKFSLESSKRDYRDVARALGLGAMLEGGLGPEGHDRVDQLVQRAVIDVDEKGTTAAGAAGISIIPRVGSDESAPRVTLNIDRPFVCSVVHVGARLPLFTAHVVDPLAGAPAAAGPDPAPSAARRT